MRRLLLVAAATMVALTACGSTGGGDDDVASINKPGDNKPSGTADPAAGKSDEDRMRDFAKCMRDHGVDMPDPEPNGGPAVRAMQADGADGEKMNKANEACKELLPNGGKPKPLSPEDLDKQRKLAKCMRDHGINMPDPDPSGQMGMTIGGPDSDPDKMDKAMKDCGMNIGGGHVSVNGGGSADGGASTDGGR
ncbi:hypothetical protein GCM10029964_004030 [Kibdelosporangium lantanae]